MSQMCSASDRSGESLALRMQFCLSLCFVKSRRLNRLRAKPRNRCGDLFENSRRPRRRSRIWARSHVNLMNFQSPSLAETMTLKPLAIVRTRPIRPTGCESAARLSDEPIPSRCPSSWNSSTAVLMRWRISGLCTKDHPVACTVAISQEFSMKCWVRRRPFLATQG